MKKLFLLIIIFCLFYQIQSFSQSFSAKFDFTTGIVPHSVSIGDLNGDGKPDLAVANAGSNSVSVLFNTTATGSSTPSFSSKTDFTTETNPFSVSIGDLNGDGKPDLAVANAASNSVSVFFNTTATGASTPSFSLRTDFTTGRLPTSVSIGDLNGDGKPDLAVANHIPNSVSVFFNTTTTGSSTPSFSLRTDFTTGSGPISVSIGDLNGDGKPDLAVANASSDSVSVFFNTTTTGSSTPSFSLRTDFAAGCLPVSVSIGDLNGDGKPDLAVANNGANSVSVFFNTTTTGSSTPSFSSKTDFTTEITPTSVSIGDLNGDGKPDLAVANRASNSVSVFFNTTATGASTPSFSLRTDFTTGTFPSSVSIGDLNGDGKPDLAVANQSINSNSVSVLLNTTPISNHTITSSTDVNGTISPLGNVSVNNGDSQSYTITPNTGYIVADVLVDGVSVGAVTSYTFSNVTSDHTISVTFKISSMAMKQAAKDLLIPYLTDPDKKIRKAAKKAIKHIDKSLEAKLWVDVNHLTKKGKKVFDEEKKAVKKLKNKKFIPPFSVDALEAINFLLTADNNLAQVAINEVVCGGNSKCEKELQKANKEMAKALVELSKNKYDKAIDHYKKAWKHAQKATKKAAAASVTDNNESISLANAINIPVDFTLSQNYPNPFNPSTVIKYALPEGSFVTLKIYNMLGQEIKTLVSGDKSAGAYSVQWNGKDNYGSPVASGTYIYRVIAGSNVVSKKMILLR